MRSYSLLYLAIGCYVLSMVILFNSFEYWTTYNGYDALSNDYIYDQNALQHELDSSHHILAVNQVKHAQTHEKIITKMPFIVPCRAICSGKPSYKQRAGIKFEIINITKIVTENISVLESCHCTPKKFKNIIKEKFQLTGVPSHFKNANQRDQIWPKLNETQDRVLSQMNLNRSTGKTKNILIFLDNFIDNVDRLKDDGCLVQDCVLVNARDPARSEGVTDLIDKADVIVSQGRVNIPNRRPEQILIWYYLESPAHASPIGNTQINWTATYRQDSVINTPYERFTFFENFTGEFPEPQRDYLRGKTKMAAWFVSHCSSDNGRMEYAMELAEYISVDIFGACSEKKSPKGERSSRMLSKHYKFYLAFENSNCVDYITEKLYWNALLHDVIPVVMGARPEDYQKVAPPHSYIHVDDFQSPRHLAEYLETLSKDSKKYNSYFRWKGTGSYINTKFWCRVCSMAHEAEISGVRLFYSDMRRWWAGANREICIQPDEARNMTWSSWRNHTVPYVQQEPYQPISLK